MVSRDSALKTNVFCRKKILFSTKLSQGPSHFRSEDISVLKMSLLENLTVIKGLMNIIR